MVTLAFNSPKLAGYARESYIREGRVATPVLYDPDLDAYVFDVASKETATKKPKMGRR